MLLSVLHKCNKYDGSKPVKSGVPEGSLLSPLLFALFINDLPLEIQSSCLMYADDVKLFRRIETADDGQLL